MVRRVPPLYFMNGFRIGVNKVLVGLKARFIPVVPLLLHPDLYQGTACPRNSSMVQAFLSGVSGSRNHPGRDDWGSYWSSRKMIHYHDRSLFMHTTLGL